MKKLIEGAGEFVGEHVVRSVLERARHRVEHFETRISGDDNLRKLEGQAYLIAANHIKPKEVAKQASGFAPDAFVLEHVVTDRTGREPRIIAKCDDGWWADNPYRYFQKYVTQHFSKGVSQGAGFIPVKKNPGSFNRDFLKAVERVVTDREPIIIFPEGNWHDDYDLERPLETGAAQIALRHDLPVVPTYIRGCDSWQPEGVVDVAFGDALAARGKTKELLTEEIGMQIADLQERVRIARSEPQNDQN
jgi:1-acyl-sn-glycerol-3-phosphate acyltransferase